MTAHFIDQGIDTGDIITRKLIKINYSDSVDKIKSKLNHEMFNLYIDLFQKVASNQPIKTHKQKEKYKYCKKLSSEEKILAKKLVNDKIYFNNYKKILQKYQIET